MKKLTELLIRSKLWKSIVRHGYPDTNRNRTLLVFSNLFLHVHPVKVRLRAIEFKRTFYLGGISLANFIILTITGVLLMFYYRPVVPQAYYDIQDLEFVVSFGLFLRNLHRWSAHLMVFTVFAHMVVTFYRGAYQTPREFNWAIGVLLLVGTLLLSYTGYLLPWDQLAFWAVSVGSNMAKSAPLIGEDIRVLLLGGKAIDEITLNRFYILHCIFIPLLVLWGIMLHLWRIRKDGGIYLPKAAPIKAIVSADIKVRSWEAVPGVAETDEPTVMTFPHLFMRELVTLLATTVVLSIFSMIFDAPLLEMADPTKTPNPAKAPWYFLGIQELLHFYSPRTASVYIPVATIIILMFIPYIPDLDILNLKRERKYLLLYLWVLVAALSVLFYFSGTYPLWCALVPLLLLALIFSWGRMAWGRMAGAAISDQNLSFWSFTWFVIVSVALIIVGVYFRGPGWSFTLPWRDGIY